MAATDNILRTQRILWAAQMGAPVLFLVVLVLQRRSGSLPTEAPAMMLPVLGVVAVIVLAASLLWPRLMLLKGLANAKLEAKEVADDEAQLFRSAPRTFRVLVDPEAAKARALSLSTTWLILGVALAEAAAMFGLVLGMMGVGLVQVAPFFVLAWLAMAVHYPSEARIMRAVEKVTGASLPSSEGTS